MAKRLFIMDGMYFAFSAYYAIRNLRDSKGRPTNAVYGFTRVLLKLLREQNPEYLVIVFDAPGKTFRDDLFDNYKGTRQETPEDLLAQFDQIDKVIAAFQIPVLRVPGVEADDVIGTLSKQSEAAGIETVLVSNDKDLYQLVTDCTKVFAPKRDDGWTWFTPEVVQERFGVLPKHVIDVLALMGDTVDNVPGVRKIGQKTAVELVQKYGSLENLYDHLDEFKGKRKEYLSEDRDNAFLSKQLVTIDRNLDVTLCLEDYHRRDFDRRRLSDVFHELEFQSLLEEFMPDAADSEHTDYQLILTAERLDAVIAQITQAGQFALDTETTDMDPMRAELCGISMSCGEGCGYYIPVCHAPEARVVANQPVECLSPGTVIEKLKAAARRPRHRQDRPQHQIRPHHLQTRRRRPARNHHGYHGRLLLD